MSLDDDLTFRARAAVLTAQQQEQYVYFIVARLEPFPPMVKVGISVDPYTRITQIAKDPGKSGDWLGDMRFCESLDILGYIQGGRPVEKALHRAWKEHRVGGEWFWYEPLGPAIDALLCDECVCPSCLICDYAVEQEMA